MIIQRSIENYNILSFSAEGVTTVSLLRKINLWLLSYRLSLVGDNCTAVIPLHNREIQNIWSTEKESSEDIYLHM